MDIDLEKELADAQKRAQFLLEEHFKTLGTVSFIQYLIRKEKICSQEIPSKDLSTNNSNPV